jgi:Ca2+-binding RTX toxin-like protein
MGSGNDSLTISSTLNTSALHGGLTTIHGGGNGRAIAGVGVTTGTIAGTGSVNGGGGPTSPLVIYGDTSQDASLVRQLPVRRRRHGHLRAGPTPTRPAPSTAAAGNPFDRNGDDVMTPKRRHAGGRSLGADALGIVIYGGAGNDTIRGTQVGDVLAGGSGDDKIYGNAGDDLLRRFRRQRRHHQPRCRCRIDAARPAGDNPSSNRDGLVAARHDPRNAGDDVIFGTTASCSSRSPTRRS